MQFHILNLFSNPVKSAVPETMCCCAGFSLHKGHCWNPACVLFITLEEGASFFNLHKSIILVCFPQKQALSKNLDAGSLLWVSFRKYMGKWGEKGKEGRSRKGKSVRGYPYEQTRLIPSWARWEAVNHASELSWLGQGTWAISSATFLPYKVRAAPGALIPWTPEEDSREPETSLRQKGTQEASVCLRIIYRWSQVDHRVTAWMARVLREAGSLYQMCFGSLGICLSTSPLRVNKRIFKVSIVLPLKGG